MIIVKSDSNENISCLVNASSIGSWEVFLTLTKIFAAWGILSDVTLVLGSEIGQHEGRLFGVEMQYRDVQFLLG
ncbi:hypothetical protein ACFX2I_037089 [Malus domestica]